ncbi:MAG: Hsp20/alpha crystallin family protein [Gammaproteobacteria bacterium]|jgi:HSP20 family protein
MTETTEVTKREPGQPARQEERRAAMMPAVDIVEDETGIRVLADLPGVSNDTLTVRIDGDTLLIEGELALDLPEGVEASYAEIQIPRFRRVFTLSRDLDTSKCDAALKDGVLTLRIPKAEHAQPRKIEVKVG